MISYRSLILLDNKDHTCTLYHDTLLMKLETCSLLLCLIHFRQYFYLIVLSAILYNKIKHPKSPLLQFNPFCLLNCLNKYIYQSWNKIKHAFTVGTCKHMYENLFMCTKEQRTVNYFIPDHSLYNAIKKLKIIVNHKTINLFLIHNVSY